MSAQWALCDRDKVEWIFCFFLSPVNFVGIFCDFGARRTDSMLQACFVLYCNARKVLLQLKDAGSVVRQTVVWTYVTL